MAIQYRQESIPGRPVGRKSGRVGLSWYKYKDY
jgi:hypothetical protein